MDAWRPRVLLVGSVAMPIADDPSLLSLHNPEFLASERGREAYLLMERYQPRLCIVTRELPDLAGDDFVRLVRADRKLRSTSIILLCRGAESDAGCGANATFDYEGGLDRAGVIERADRLMCVLPRAQARTSVCLSRQASAPSPRSTCGETINLSESGMLLASGSDLDLGEDLWLHFVLPRKTDLIAARGRVVRHQSGHGGTGLARPRFGLEFVTLLPEDQLHIRSYVRDLAAA